MSVDHGALIAGIVDRLLAATVPNGTVSLDAIGDAVGGAPVSYEDIDAIITALERAQRTVTQPTIDVTGTLKRVLTAARTLRAANNRVPCVQEIEQATGLDRRSVLTALRFADTLGR